MGNEFKSIFLCELFRSILGFGKVFFSNNWQFDKLYSLSVKILPNKLREFEAICYAKSFLQTLRVSRLFTLCRWVSNVCAHCNTTALCLTLVDVFFEEV